MTPIRKYFILLFLFFSCHSLFAQQPYPWKKDTIIGENKYKIYNNWLSAGAGWSRNFSFGNDQFNLNMDYHFHITDKYFQIGLFFSGDAFRDYNNYNFHAGYGKRIESGAINFSYFGGASFSTGYKKSGTQTQGKPFNEPGVFGQVEYIRKIKYDVGVGAGLFADANLLQTTAGFKLVVYFSGAFKGRKGS